MILRNSSILKFWNRDPGIAILSEENEEKREEAGRFSLFISGSI